jgi:fumarylacetoacetase
MQLDDTHDPELEGWMNQRLTRRPTFRFRTCRTGASSARPNTDWSIGVAIGDRVLDMRRGGLIDSHDINLPMRLARGTHEELRQAISAGCVCCAGWNVMAGWFAIRNNPGSIW